MNNSEIQQKFNELDAGSVYKNLAHNRGMSLAKLIVQMGMPCRSLLDAGARDGFALKGFKETGLWDGTRLVGIDIVDDFCDDIEDYGEAIRADLQDLSMHFDDKKFDWTLCSHTLEHCPDLEAAVNEMYRVTRYGCLVVVPLECEKEFENNESHYHRSLDPIDWLQWIKHPDWLMHSASTNQYSELIAVMTRKRGVE